MKRFLVPVMATMFYIVVLLSGCDLVFPGADESDNESSSLGKKYLSEFENKWCYQRLNSDLKLGYGEIYTAVKDGFENDETVTISDSENDTRHDYIGLRIELSKPLRNQDDSKRLYTAFVSIIRSFSLSATHTAMRATARVKPTITMCSAWFIP